MRVIVSIPDDRYLTMKRHTEKMGLTPQIFVDRIVTSALDTHIEQWSLEEGVKA